MHDDRMLPPKWSLACVTEVFPGKDNIERVVKLKTLSGTYTRPITKVALLMPAEQ